MDQEITEKAIADFTQAIKFDPRHFKACYNRGNAYYDSGEYNKAISDFTRAILLIPEHTQLNENIEKAKQKLKNQKE